MSRKLVKTNALKKGKQKAVSNGQNLDHEEIAPYTLHHIRCHTDHHDALIDCALLGSDFYTLLERYNLPAEIAKLFCEREFREVRLSSYKGRQRTKLRHEKVIERVATYIRKNLSKRLYCATGLVILEALVYGLNEPLPENVLRSWEQRTSAQGRSSDLELHSGKGRPSHNDLNVYQEQKKWTADSRFVSKVVRAIQDSPVKRPPQLAIAQAVGLSGDDALRAKLRKCGVRKSWISFCKESKADKKKNTKL